MKSLHAWKGMINLTGKTRDYKTQKGVLNAFHSDKPFVKCSVAGNVKNRTNTVYPSDLEGVRVKLHFDGGNVQTMYTKGTKKQVAKRRVRKKIGTPKELKQKAPPIGYIPTLALSPKHSVSDRQLSDVLFYWNINSEFVYMDGDKKGQITSQSNLFGEKVKLIYDDKRAYIIVTADKACLIDLKHSGLLSDPDITF